MAKKQTNEQPHDPTFAESVRPILDELENAFVGFAAAYPGQQAGFNKDDFRAVICMFFSVALEMMWAYHDRLGLPMPMREDVAERFANEIRASIFNHCDIDTRKLYKK